MLPEAKSYLISGGFSPRAASYLLIGLFLAGVVGIQIISRIMHHFIPTHIVDCDHTHDNEEAANSQEEMGEQHGQHDPNQADDDHPQKFKFAVDEDDEETPLLARNMSVSPPQNRRFSAQDSTETEQPTAANGFLTAPTSRRPSMVPRTLRRTLSKLTSAKIVCDETGPCKGFSDPCSQGCFIAANRRGSKMPHSAPYRQTTFTRSSTNFTILHTAQNPADTEEEVDPTTRLGAAGDEANRPPFQLSYPAIHPNHHTVHNYPDSIKQDGGQRASHRSSQSDPTPEHHHHVPTNAFLSIGLQTSIAIALHKAPEGFITYATNHANPTLGFAVFMALFIHNITEGFAMALPLYLALKSRTKAVIWSSFLGGVSQPLGAGIAAIWFKVARGENGLGKPSEDVYGCMFAITAGVMASVALQLYSESLGLSHNKGICIAFAFLGMGILGVSSALTA